MLLTSELKGIYRRLLKKIESQYIGIQLVPILDRNEIARFNKGLGGRKDTIQLLRRNQTLDYINCNPQESNQILEDELCKIIDTSNKPLLKEIVILAHEFGHSFSSDSNIDDTYNLLRQQKYLTRGEKARVLKEELMAWRIARRVLKSLGFRNRSSFKKIRKVSLSSYKQIRIC